METIKDPFVHPKDKKLILECDCYGCLLSTAVSPIELESATPSMTLDVSFLVLRVVQKAAHL